MEQSSQDNFVFDPHNVIPLSRWYYSYHPKFNTLVDHILSDISKTITDKKLIEFHDDLGKQVSRLGPRAINIPLIKSKKNTIKIKKNLNYLLCNLITAGGTYNIFDWTCFHAPFGKSQYTNNTKYGKHFLTFNIFPKLMYALVDAGYLNIARRGYTDLRSVLKDRRETSLYPTLKFKELLIRYDILDDPEVKFIRMGSDGNPHNGLVIRTVENSKKEKVIDNTFDEHDFCDLPHENTLIEHTTEKFDLRSMRIDVMKYNEILTNNSIILPLSQQQSYFNTMRFREITKYKKSLEILENQRKHGYIKDNEEFINKRRKILPRSKRLIYRSVNFRIGTVFRSFIKTYDLGGRFYGGWWMSLPSEYRSKILINGNTTREYDITSIHPKLLCTNEELNLDNGDFYNSKVPEEYMGILTKDDVRSISKKLVIVDINNDNGRRLYQIILNRIKHSGDYSLFSKLDIETIETLYNEQVKLQPVFFDKLKRTKNIGISLQFIDSEICAMTLQHFVKKGIPILSVHDSFIGETNHYDEIVDVTERNLENVRAKILKI